MGKEFVFASIYGPNHDTEIAFYDTLKNNLKQFRCPIIVGGDWNATLDCSNIGTNIDIVNMRNIPSIRRSQKISELRILHPNKKEYTYVPSNLLEHANFAS